MDSIFLPELRGWIYPPYPFAKANSSATVAVTRQNNQQQSGEPVLNANIIANEAVATAGASTTSSVPEREKALEKRSLSVPSSSRSGLTAADIICKPEVDALKSELFGEFDNPSQDEFMAFLNAKEEKCYLDDGGIDGGDDHNITFNLDSDSDSDSSVSMIDIDQAYRRYSGTASVVAAVVEEDTEKGGNSSTGPVEDTASVKGSEKGDTSSAQDQEAESASVSSRGRRRRKTNNRDIEPTGSDKQTIGRRAVVSKIKSDKKKSLNRDPEWEEELRKNLGLEKEEFSKFVESQGFLTKSSKLKSLHDFGVPEPKGAPKFAPKIRDSYYDQSNALRLYRNLLKASHSHGITITNATDQAFYHPDNSISSVPKSDRLLNLNPDDMIVSVDLYHASTFLSSRLLTELRTAKLPAIALTVEILASQTVANLISRLFCENDLVYIAEIDHPNEATKLDWKLCAGVYDKRTFQSACIFIHDTIYTANVVPSYSHTLNKWAGQNYLGNDQKIKTSHLSTEIRDTGFRPGYPYLYRHNDCEHLLVFTNVRTVHPTDPQIPKLYPRITFMHSLPHVPCRINPKHLAKFVVKNDPRLPESVVPLCKECCITFCYTGDGRSRDRKTGDFQLYPLIQMSTLPFSPSIQ